MLQDAHDGNSITRWIAALKAGNAEAAQRIAERYWERLALLARNKLGKAPRRVSDEEDIVASVFESLCRRAAAGGFAELSTREDLWWLLLTITKRKIVNQVRRQTSQKRGGTPLVGRAIAVRGESELEFSLDQLVGDAPTPDLLVSLQEEYSRLLGLLRDDTFRRVVVWRMEGYSNREIAERLGTATRTIDRKLALIRKKWEQELVQ